MRTLHLSLRVADLERSLAFYRAVGYEVVGRVPGTGFGDLTMLKLPDDEFVTLELQSPSAAAADHAADQAADGSAGLSCFVIQVEEMDETVSHLASGGVEAEAPSSPDGTDDVFTSWLTDPDGHRIELVQWPDGHAVGMSAADFPT